VVRNPFGGRPLEEPETVTGSRSGAGLELKARILDLLASGQTVGQVVDFLVDSYGPSIILAPCAGEEIFPQSVRDRCGAVQVFGMDWHPNGKQVVMALSQQQSAGGDTLWLYDLQTRKASRIAEEVESADGPVFSPDGRSSAFFSMEAGERFPTVYAVVTQAVSRLRSSRPLSPMTISPLLWLDNETLVFSASDRGAASFESPGFANLFMVSLDGQQRQLTAFPAYEGVLAVDRSQRRILFEAECPLNTWHLLTYDVDANLVGSLTTALELSNRASQVVISPSHRLLAFNMGQSLWVAPFVASMPLSEESLVNCKATSATSTPTATVAAPPTPTAPVPVATPAPAQEPTLTATALPSPTSSVGEVYTQTKDTGIEPYPAKDFSLQLLDGRILSLSDLRGQVVMVDFSASWCPPCRQEAPTLARVNEAYRGQGVEFVGIFVWDNSRDVREHVQRYGIEYAVGMDEQGAIAQDYGVTGIPTKYFIDQEGMVVRKLVGPVGESQLREILHDMGVEAQ